jgi:3-oxoacyl-[acyl-carrier protein] reductase
LACVRHTAVKHQIKIIKEGSGVNKQLSSSLSGKVAVVTGPTRGIGLAIAREFAENNDAEVVICSGSKQRAALPAKGIRSKAFGAKLDITDISDVVQLLQEIIGVRHQIDILGNNTRYHFDSKIWSKIGSELESISEVLHGSMRTCRNVISTIIGTNGRTTQNGTVSEGVIMASTPAISAHTQGSLYTFAKAAIITMTKHNTCVHGRSTTKAFIAHRNIATGGAYNSMSTDKKMNALEEPSMKRWDKPEEVSKIVARIASSSFSSATGNALVVGGGTVSL